MNVLPVHTCSYTKKVPMLCLDEKGNVFGDVQCHANLTMNLVAGMEHSVQFFCCECEPLSVTLVRAQLWPSSPQQPRIAFSFKLLDWAEALL